MLDVVVFGAALFLSHVAAFVIGTQKSSLGLLAYPAGSAVATVILRSLARPDDAVEPATLRLRRPQDRSRLRPSPPDPEELTRISRAVDPLGNAGYFSV